MATNIDPALGNGSAVSNFVAGLSEQLDDDLQRIVGIKPGDSGYYPPSSDWLTWAMEGKLVRLDVAIYAIHIAAARVYFKPFEHVHGLQLQKARDTAVDLGIDAASFKFLSGIIGTVFRQVLLFINDVPLESMNRTIEKSIRTNVAKTQRELHDLAMKQSKKKKHKKTVSSRHKTKKQRRPNGSGS